MIWPEGLAVFYPYWHEGLPTWEVALAGVVVAGLCAVAIVRRRKEPWLLVGWCWYLVMLLPVLGIIQVGDQAHADRYTYLPQIGIYLALAWLVAEWQISRAALGALMAGVIGVLMVCAWRQAGYWRNSETLWSHTLACTTNNDTAENNLGTDLLAAGKVDDAITHFRNALRIEPEDADSHYSLGTALLQKGSIDEAIAEFQGALQIEPGDADAHYNLAAAFRQEGKLDEAIAHYQSALQFKPDNAEAHYNLAVALRQEGRVDEAITHYEAALKLKPDNADAENNLGNLLLQKGSIDDAIGNFQKAVAINPASGRAHNNLGNALLRKGRAGDALAQFQQALKLEPDDPTFQSNLAWFLATCAGGSIRDGKRAVELARRANALTGGDNAMVLRTLAAALAEDGELAEAERTAEHALDLAIAKSNSGLAAALRSEIMLYKSGQPFHAP
jgi:tetratricopeptide (TPR) repeat protein